MAEEPPAIVRSVRTIDPVRAYCTGFRGDVACPFTVEETRFNSEIEVRRMARAHADCNEGHIVEVVLVDLTVYTKVY